MTDLLCGLFFGLGGAVCHKTDDKTDGGGADPAETEARKGQNATDRFDDAIEVACGTQSGGQGAQQVIKGGDQRIPNIIIRKTKPLGHYGRLRKAYLEMHRPILFNELVLSDKLFEHCAEIDEAARNRMELIVRSLAEQNGVTEQLKADNQMEWVRQMNACKAQAEEIVKAELIYD